MSMFFFFLPLDDGGGWTPPTDTYPTAFSPTARGGVGTEFGVWADGGMRTVKHSTTTSWIGIRAITGIADGEEYEWRVVIEGSTGEQGIAIGNASADLQSYVGNDANGFVYFGHVGEIYHNGSSVHTVATFAAGDVVHVAVSRVSDEMWIYKQTGGVGAFTEYGPYDISALGAGTWYPIHALYNSSGQATYDFGHTEFTSQSGFARGPIGPYGGWLLPHIELYFGADTTRMWEAAASAGTAAPDVTTGDPIGAWHGVNYARLLSTSTSPNRPEKTANGVKLDATGGLKQLNHALSVALSQPQAFSVMIRVDDASVKALRAGFATSAADLSSGQAVGTGTAQAGRIRMVNTNATAAFAGAVRTFVITYDGASAGYMLDADGNWSAATVGSGVANWTHIILRAIATDAGIGTVRVMQIATDAITETEARNWQYWAVNNLEAATA